MSGSEMLLFAEKLNHCTVRSRDGMSTSACGGNMYCTARHKGITEKGVAKGRVSKTLGMLIYAAPKLIAGYGRTATKRFQMCSQAPSVQDSGEAQGLIFEECEGGTEMVARKTRQRLKERAWGKEFIAGTKE